jgi:hypothetical protein
MMLTALIDDPQDKEDKEEPYSMCGTAKQSLDHLD